MLIFGHMGVSLGVARLLAAITAPRAAQPRPVPLAVANASPLPQWNGLISTGGWLDYRLLFIGALLPDIIDKPLGMWLLKDTLGNGRVFSHSLLFVLATFSLGWYFLRRWKQGWLLVLAFGSFLHIVEDGMWQMPPVLFWPLFGWGFPHHSTIPGPLAVLKWAVASSFSSVWEITGFALLVLFVAELLWRRKLLAFLRTGIIR